jgi:hypothetical protein
MDSLLQNLSHLISNLVNNASVIGVVLGALTTLASAISAALAGKQVFAETTTKEAQTEEETPEERHARMRLDEAKYALQRQESIARRNQWASSLLVFGQYIIGGALASSFIQDSLSKPIVGTLGVLVLLSSLILQRYRPDLKVRGARERIVKLRSLVREVQDEMIALKVEREGALSIDKIIRKLSRGLTGIETSEIKEFDDLSRDTKALTGNDDT